MVDPAAESMLIMPHYLFRGIYAADKQDALTTWPGALLSLEQGQWALPHSLTLPVARQKTLPGDVIRQGTAFIHGQRQADRSVLVYCPTGIPYAAVFILAYLIEFEAMALSDAYIFLANYRALVPPPRVWVYAVVEHYGLDYSKAEILDEYLPVHMAMLCSRSIHLVDQGIYISNIEALQNPARVRELGIEAVLRVDNHDRRQGQWPPDFILCDLPLRDGHAIAPDQLAAATRFICQQVQADRRVLVHCQEGISRSAAMVLAYLIEYGGLTLAEAARLVVLKHPMAEPHPTLLASLVEIYDLPYAVEQVHDWGFFYRLTKD
jgi:protein-tyrosine phosphatase